MSIFENRNLCTDEFCSEKCDFLGRGLEGRKELDIFLITRTESLGGNQAER